MYTVQFKKIAQSELNDATIWYADRSEKVALEFINSLENKLSLIKSGPTNYLNLFESFYEVHLGKFPYTLIYKVIERKKEVLIVSVFHQKRNPKKKYK